MNNDSLGIYCLKDKTFYYLESGEVYIGNTVDRLKKTLTHRDLIEFTPDSFMNTHDYKIISCREAKIQDHKMVPIYISEHIRKSVENRAEEKTESKTWK